MRFFGRMYLRPRSSTKEGVVFEELTRDFIPHTQTSTPFTRNNPLEEGAGEESLEREKFLLYHSCELSGRSFGMKVTGSICCALVFTCLLKVVNCERTENKIQQQFLDTFAPDESLKMKRPFCNAFTGCGRKRSFYESSADAQDTEVQDTIRLPLSVYKALLRAAYQNVRNSDRSMNDYQLSDIPQVYLSRKLPLRKRFDNP